MEIETLMAPTNDPETPDHMTMIPGVVWGCAVLVCLVFWPLGCFMFFVLSVVTVINLLNSISGQDALQELFGISKSRTRRWQRLINRPLDHLLAPLLKSAAQVYTDHELTPSKDTSDEAPKNISPSILELLCSVDVTLNHRLTEFGASLATTLRSIGDSPALQVCSELNDQTVRDALHREQLRQQHFKDHRLLTVYTHQMHCQLALWGLSHSKALTELCRQSQSLASLRTQLDQALQLHYQCSLIELTLPISKPFRCGRLSVAQQLGDSLLHSNCKEHWHLLIDDVPTFMTVTGATFSICVSKEVKTNFNTFMVVSHLGIPHQFILNKHSFKKHSFCRYQQFEYFLHHKSNVAMMYPYTQAPSELLFGYLPGENQLPKSW